MQPTIVIGVDGSEPAHRAVEWCATYAARTGVTVVAVHAIEMPVYGSSMSPYVPIPYPTPEQRLELEDVVARDWCKPLADAGVPFRVVLTEGPAARSISDAAAREDAGLVVVGRRGRNAFTEFLLGSTSRSLSHHVTRPLVIVP